MTEYISASRIKTKERCAMLWHYIYEEGLRPKPTPAMLRGIRIHKMLEDYVNCHNVVLPVHIKKQVDKYVSEGLWLAEYEFKREFLGEHVQGKIDLSTVDLSRVVDYKTTSNLTFALDAEGLSNDTQSNMYAAICMNESGNAKISLEFCYFTDKETHIVAVEFEREKTFAKIKDTLEKYHSIPVQLQDYPSRKCYMYGRKCDFFDVCRKKSLDAKITLWHKG